MSDRYVRVCRAHHLELVFTEARWGVEEAACPAGHPTHAWHVLDVQTSRVVGEGRLPGVPDEGEAA